MTNDAPMPFNGKRYLGMDNGQLATRNSSPQQKPIFRPRWPFFAVNIIPCSHGDEKLQTG